MSDMDTAYTQGRHTGQVEVVTGHWGAEFVYSITSGSYRGAEVGSWLTEADAAEAMRAQVDAAAARDGVNLILTAEAAAHPAQTTRHQADSSTVEDDGYGRTITYDED